MKSMSKTYQIGAPLESVFEILTNVDLIETWTGSPAKMDLTDEFSLWGGDIHGRNTSVTRTKVEQDWKVKSWQTYSQVVISLSSTTEHETLVKLEHTHIPNDGFESIKTGWDNYYFGPVKELAEQRYRSKKDQ